MTYNCSLETPDIDNFRRHVLVLKISNSQWLQEQ